MDLATLKAELLKNGFDVEPFFDGVIHRFNREGKLNGWAIGETVDDQCVFSYGDWKTGEVFNWASSQTQDWSAKWDTHRETQDKLKKELHLQAAQESESLWDTLHPYGTHTYLDSKKLTGALYGARLSSDTLYVPIRDCDGKLWSLQKIYGTGVKRFFEGGKIRSCFHWIGEKENLDRIFLCEGFATGASIYQAFEKRWPVVCALNAGNLFEVGIALRRKYEGSQIIVCADNDSGTKGNPGLAKAKRAAQEIGAVVCYPTFATYDNNPTDFNDLHCREGLERVRLAIENGLSQGDAQTIPLTVRDKEGKKKKPTELQVVRALLDHHGDTFVQAAKDLYRFDGKMWKRLGPNEENALKAKIQALSGDTYDIRNVKSTFEHFLSYVPDRREEILTPKPFLANFKNGTLHLDIDREYKYSFRFEPHNQCDFITNVLPMDYVDNGITNDEFERMLERVFCDEPDGLEKRRAVAQMYGACILPAFPHFFLLHGPGASGKSTLIKIAKNLVSDENRCGVEPHEFRGFLMESMIGKLVNLVTDINVNVPIDDGNIKKVEDRIPFRIDRKFKEAVYAPLPAIHIFGANDIPKTLNGASNAHERRWTFLELSTFRASGLYNRDYDIEVFQRGPEGILRFALEGLKDLLGSRGHYINPVSGRERLLDWQLDTDYVGQFVLDIHGGDYKFRVEAAGCVKTSEVWEVFKSWCQTNTSGKYPIERNKFYRYFEQKGFKKIKKDGLFFFEGLELKVP